MSKISEAFAHGKAFIPFFTCGDPDLETSYEIIKTAATNGADLIQLGIPFSDPTAEGPVIQAANLRALKYKVTTDQVFELVKRLRQEGGVKVPFIFMTYANVVFSYGIERFMQRCAEVGMDGMLLADVPFEEKEEFEPMCVKYDLDLISIVTSTSEQRIVNIAKEARGFLYIASGLASSTREQAIADLKKMIAMAREHTSVPCAIGFGIATPEQAHDMASISDGAIVGSAVLKLVEQYGKDAPQHVGEYVRQMKDAIRDL